MEGYLSRRDALGADGKGLHPNDPKKAWHLCFVQLSGTVLSVWSVAQMEQAAREGREVPPAYINVTDSFVDLVGNLIEDPNEVPGSRGRYENVFALNSAGNNRILFCVEGVVGRRLVQAWVNAIRLASWEKVRLEEIYTGALIRARLGSVGSTGTDNSPMQGPPPAIANMNVASPLAKSGKMEGWVKARFMGSTEWKKCWLVLSKDKAEAGNSGGGVRRLWNKLGGAGDRSSVMSIASDKNPTAPTTPGRSNSISGEPAEIEPPPGSNGAPGIAQFFLAKKDKKPFATMLYAAHAFAVYPSRPELVEGSSLFKVEGAFPNSQVLSATNRIRQTGWVMIMPELEAGSRGANAEMMKWVIAFMDAYKLYGRPAGFIWDARDPLSAFFAYPIGQYKDRLFLDRELAEFLDVREERHLATRTNLHGIMAARMRGERTPLLPPLPQPNNAHTRQLNGARGLAGSEQQQSEAPQDSQQPAQEERRADASPAPALPAMQSGLSTMNGGSNNGSEAGRSGLDPIGERSREGSYATQATAVNSQHPNEKSTSSAHPVGASSSSVNGVGSQLAPVKEQQREPANYATSENARFGSPRSDAQSLRASHLQDNISTSSSRRPLSPPQVSQPQTHTSLRTGATSPASSQPSSLPYRDNSNLAANDEAASIRSGRQQAPSATNNTASEPSAIGTGAIATGAGVAGAAAASSLANRDIGRQNSVTNAVPTPSGRGAEAEQTSGAQNAARNGSLAKNRQSETDFASSYDEGALFYLRSMSDQTPAVPSKNTPPKPTVQTSTNPLLGPAITGNQAKDSPVADTPSSYTQPSYAPSQATEPLSRNASARAPIAPVGAAAGVPDEDRLDEDALAAYSYLDQPPSPEGLGRQRSLPKVPAASQPSSRSQPIAAPAAATQPAQPVATTRVTPQVSYPSTFGQNKRAQERKEAAQAQAAAHAEALSKPGKRAGQKKGLRPKGRHAWGDETSEEEEEEEEEDEDVEDPSLRQSRSQTQTKAVGPDGIAGAARPPVVSAASQRGESPANGSAALTAAAAGLPPPGRATSQYSSGSGSGTGFNESGRNSPRQGESGAIPTGQMRAGGSHPALAQQYQQQQQQRHSVFNSHLAAPHTEDDSRSFSPSNSAGNRQTFVQLNSEEQPGSMTTVFQRHGLLEAGAQDKQERSAKQQELEARMAGVGLVNVPSKPPPPQSGLLGAITAHERDRKAAGGYGATLTERERQRVEAERRQRDDDAAAAAMMRNSMSVGPAQGAWGHPGAMMPGYNPYMWQQMMMMNPMMGMGMGMPPGFGGGPGSQMGGGHQAAGSNGGSPPPQMPQMDPYMQQQMQQQMAASMAAQQAYMQAMSQHGGGGSMVHGEQGGVPTSQMPTSPSMMSMNPMMMGGMHPMSMYGMPPNMMGGFPMGQQGSEYGSQIGAGSPRQQSQQPQRRFEGQQERPGQNGSPLKR